MGPRKDAGLLGLSGEAKIVVQTYHFSTIIFTVINKDVLTC